MARYKLNYLDNNSGLVFAKLFNTKRQVHHFIVENDIIMFVLIDIERFEVVDL